MGRGGCSGGGAAWLLLDDERVAPETLAAGVVKFTDMPTTGGPCIDASGAIYVSDCDRQRIVKITRDRTETTVISDARLVWGDALWIDSRGSCGCRGRS